MKANRLGIIGAAAALGIYAITKQSPDTEAEQVEASAKGEQPTVVNRPAEPKNKEQAVPAPQGAHEEADDQQELEAELARFGTGFTKFMACDDNMTDEEKGDIRAFDDAHYQDEVFKLAMERRDIACANNNAAKRVDAVQRFQAVNDISGTVKKTFEDLGFRAEYNLMFGRGTIAIGANIFYKNPIPTEAEALQAELFGEEELERIYDGMHVSIHVTTPELDANGFLTGFKASVRSNRMHVYDPDLSAEENDALGVREIEAGSQEELTQAIIEAVGGFIE